MFYGQNRAPTIANTLAYFPPWARNARYGRFENRLPYCATPAGAAAGRERFGSGVAFIVRG